MIISIIDRKTTYIDKMQEIATTNTQMKTINLMLCKNNNSINSNINDNSDTKIITIVVTITIMPTATIFMTISVIIIDMQITKLS